MGLLPTRPGGMVTEPAAAGSPAQPEAAGAGDGGRRGRRQPAAPLPATRLAPKGSRSSHWPCSQAHPRKAFPNAYVPGKTKRTGGGSSGFLRAIFSALKFAVMLTFFPPPPPHLPSLRPSSVWQRLTREPLTFEARALGSNYLLRYPLYASPLLTQGHDARMDLVVWDRCKCLLRPPSTSGCATKSPSSSPGESGEGTGFLEFELEQNLFSKRGWLGHEPHGSAAMLWPVSPS